MTNNIDIDQSEAAAMKQKLIEAKGVVGDRVGAMAKAVTNAIKAHPLIAVGVAFGVGYVAMRLVRRGG